MTIKLADFIGIVKREGRYGTLAVTTDQPTADILNAINVRAARIWGAADWKWLREKLAFAVTPGTVEYAVTALSGNPIDRILNLIPYDTTTSPQTNGRPLAQMEIGDFYTSCDQVNEPPSVPRKYINIGQNSLGQWVVRIWPGPSSAFTMTGYAKAVLPTFLASDIAANTAIAYFPNGVVLDALMEGVMIDIGLIQGMTPETALANEQMFDKKIKHLAGEQLGVATDNTPLTSPLPDYIRNRFRGSRLRRGMRVF